jgi:MATE family multidrug resistance protein
MQVKHIVFPALFCNLFAAICNLVLNWLFVYGCVFGCNNGDPSNFFTGFGFIGSAVATACTQWILLGSFSIFVYKHCSSLVNSKWDIEELLSGEKVNTFLCGQVSKIAMAAILEEWQLQLISALAARLGSVEIATHNALLNLFFFLTSFNYGVATATTVRVARFLARNDSVRAIRVGWVSLSCSMFMSIIVSITIYICRDDVGKLFSSDPKVWNLTSSLAVFIAICYTAMALFYTVMGILDGQGRPGPVATAFVIGAWGVSIPAAYLFAFQANLGLIGLWYGLACGYGIVTLIAGYAVVTSDWEAIALDVANSNTISEFDEQDAILENVEQLNTVNHGPGQAKDSPQLAHAKANILSSPSSPRLKLFGRRQSFTMPSLADLRHSSSGDGISTERFVD